MPDSTSALVNQLANPPSPFDMLQKGVGAVTALKDYQAKQAIANAYTQSIDPDTGQVDQGKFNTLMRGGAASWAAGPAMQQQGQAQGAQGEGVQQDVQGKLSQLAVHQAYLTPLLGKAMNGEVTAQDLTDALNTVPPGVITPQVRQMIQQQIASGADPNTIVKGGYFASQAGRAMLTGQQPTMLQTGPTATNINPFSPVGGAAPSGPVSMGLSPENQLQLTHWLNEPYDYQDQDGTWHRGGTKLDWYNARGGNPYAVYNNGNMPAPGSPPSMTPAPASTGPVSTVTTGRAPVPQGGGGVSGPGGGGGTPGPTSVPPVPPRPGAPAQPGAQPSTEALPGPIVDQGQKDYAAALTASRTMNQRLGPLRNAMALLRTNPDLQTGPGQEQWNEAATGAAAALNLPVPANSTAFQELAKYTAQYIRGQSTAGQTDLGRLETEASNPKPTSQSRDALQTLLAKAIGAERLQTAALDYFNSQYPDTVTAAKHSGRFTVDTSAWLKRQDQTAFAVDEMSPDQVAAYFRGLSGTFDPKTGAATGAKADFINSRNDATKLYPSIQLNPNARVAPPPAAPPPAPAPTPPPIPPTPPLPSGFRTPAQMYGGGVP